MMQTSNQQRLDCAIVALKSHLELIDRQERIDSAIELLRTRLDRKGQGKPCGKGWISKDKKCGDKSRKQLASDLKAGDAGAKARVAKGKQLAAERSALSRQVAADKGKKPVEKVQPVVSVNKNRVAKLPEGVSVIENDAFKRYDFKVDDRRFSIAFMKGKISEVMFDADDSFDLDPTMPDSTRRRAALRLGKIFQYDAAQRPEGYQYKCSAYTGDNYGNRRSKAYERMGFTAPISDMPGGSQYAIVQNGKVVPDLEQAAKRKELFDLSDIGLDDLLDVDLGDMTGNDMSDRDLAELLSSFERSRNRMNEIRDRPRPEML